VVCRVHPQLLTVVWVGFDDNQPVSLSGSQAALPIWTQFMKNATAGQSSIPFDVPEGIAFAEIDRDTGKLATPDARARSRNHFSRGQSHRILRTAQMISSENQLNTNRAPRTEKSEQPI
jgi:membrane carboxypeptidase/penicillin-binding protein